MSKFGMEVTALIAQHYPHALRGDAAQIAQCSSELATCLGGLLAFAYRFGGEAGVIKASGIMLQKIVDNASAIDAKAGEIIRTGIAKPIGH